MPLHPAACASMAHICIASVDFPHPGGPPSNITDPATRPPPSNRSSSGLPRLRGSSDLLLGATSFTGVSSPGFPVADSRTTQLRLDAAPPEPFPPLRKCEGLECRGDFKWDCVKRVSEFHASQCVHCPLHFGASAPHSEHTYVVGRRRAVAGVAIAERDRAEDEIEARAIDDWLLSSDECNRIEAEEAVAMSRSVQQRAITTKNQQLGCCYNKST